MEGWMEGWMLYTYDSINETQRKRSHSRPLVIHRLHRDWKIWVERGGKERKNERGEGKQVHKISKVFFFCFCLVSEWTLYVLLSKHGWTRGKKYS